jgi:hypothetical protein
MLQQLYLRALAEKQSERNRNESIMDQFFKQTDRENDAEYSAKAKAAMPPPLKGDMALQYEGIAQKALGESWAKMSPVKRRAAAEIVYQKDWRESHQVPDMPKEPPAPVGYDNIVDLINRGQVREQAIPGPVKELLTRRAEEMGGPYPEWMNRQQASSVRGPSKEDVAAFQEKTYKPVEQPDKKNTALWASDRERMNPGYLDAWDKERTIKSAFTPEQRQLVDANYYKTRIPVPIGGRITRELTELDKASIDPYQRQKEIGAESQFPGIAKTQWRMGAWDPEERVMKDAYKAYRSATADYRSPVGMSEEPEPQRLGGGDYPQRIGPLQNAKWRRDLTQVNPVWDWLSRFFE